MRSFESKKTVVACLLGLAACADEPQERAAPAGAAAPAQTAAASSGAAVDEPKAATEPAPEATGGAQKTQSGSGRAGPRPSGVKLAIVSGLQGSLTQQQVEQTIGAAREDLRACYGGADARIEVSLQISPSGEVADVGVRRSEPGQPKQKECAEAKLGKLKFPAPNASLKLELGIYLEPSD